MRRVVAVAVVLVLHVGLIAMFATSRIARREEASDESRMTVVLLSLRGSQAAASIEIDPETFLNATAGPGADLSAPSMAGSSAITPPPDDIEEEVSRPPRTIDWASEARLAASRTVDSLDEQRRRDAAFAAPGTPSSLKKPPPPAPEFGWSKAHTRRIEPLPEGGTLIRINDRCALVLYVGLFPVCQIGKIEARGDLFEHLRDPDAPEE